MPRDQHGSRRPGFLQEQDGSFSMRRLLAIVYAAAGVCLFFIGGLHNSMTAVYAGCACTVASIAYPALTTASDIKGVLGATQGMMRQGPDCDQLRDSEIPSVLDK